MLDSTTNYKDYIAKAVELGQKAIAFTEHGNIYQWTAKKMACEKAGLKYIHGCEVYLTEKLEWEDEQNGGTKKIRDNYHTILLAKNYKGVQEINSLVSLSNQADHFYYKPRITFDEFLRISDNVIKISACLASPLNHYRVENENLKSESKRSEIKDMYDRLLHAYDYLEIQPHDFEGQYNYNIHLMNLSAESGIPLIAGTDTHSLNQYKAECRTVLQYAKGIDFGDEDTFDLTYKSYDELVGMFEKQGMVENVYLQAIENTNVMANSIEEFELDTSFKYPILHDSKDGKTDKDLLHEAINIGLEEKIKSGAITQEQIEPFRKAIVDECKVFEKIDMSGFMLFMSELAKYCKSHDIPLGFNRGSCGGSRVAYLTDIIDLNPETWHTVFSRFANEDRKEIGDIDIDVSPSDRDKVYEYIINRFGQKKTAFILAIGTIKERGCIDEIGRGLRHKWRKEQVGEIDESKCPYSLSIIDKVKADYIDNPDEAKCKYPEIFKYFDGLVGVAISQSMHPAGIVASPITLRDNYGTLISDHKEILQIDMDCVHEVGLVKYDILGLKNVEIIKDTYKLIGLPYPKSHEINWDDQAVWKDMLKSPVGIFQMEGNFAFQLLKKYEPKSIFDMSLVTAAIRPSGASYRDSLIARIPHKNPSPIIDELLADNNGYLVYQEDVIKFLQQICGFSGSEADNTRRAIGRKDEERLKAALPKILEGYCEKSSQPREIAEQEAKEFIQIIQDASSYMFGYNHSVGYCMIGYLCAYLRYYYPYEFITAYLNNANTEDDISNGSKLAKEYGIEISYPKYGMSKDKYIFHKDEHVIAKGIKSVKWISADAANSLYELSSEIKTESFMELLKEIFDRRILDSRQLKILTEIDFFIDFGNSKELETITEYFMTLKKGSVKQVSKGNKEPWLEEIIAKHSDETQKMYKVRQDEVLELLHEVEDKIRSDGIQDYTFSEKIMFQKEYLGYVSMKTGNDDDRLKLIIMDIFPLKTKLGKIWSYVVNAMSIGSGRTSRLTIGEWNFKQNPLKQWDIIMTQKSYLRKDLNGYWTMVGYEKIV